MMREIAAMRHQFDQEFVIDASATTATFGLTATPWDEVIGATAGACARPPEAARGRPSLPWGHGFCLGPGHPGVVWPRSRCALRRVPPGPPPAGAAMSGPTELPVPDTADVRSGPEVSEELLSVLPLLGEWHGEGQAAGAGG